MRPVRNPPNPWLTEHVELLGPAPDARLEVHEERARSIVSSNDSPDVGFRYSVNPYRGCFHACAYCYARPTHEYLGWGAGTDFDRRIVVKVNAPELLARHLARPSWRGELLAFSGVTDCYQPLEASYALTRRCLEVCLAARNPVAIVTKGALVERDAGLLAALAVRAGDAQGRPGASVDVSLAFADDALSAAIEPGATPPSRRLLALRRLAEAGVPVGVLVAPVVPGLNDEQIPAILQRAAEAGAAWAHLVLLRLPGSVDAVFEERLREVLPQRADKVLSQLVALRGGRRNESRFGLRQRGRGDRWQVVESVFASQCRRLGLVHHPRPMAAGTPDGVTPPRDVSPARRPAEQATPTRPYAARPHAPRSPAARPRPVRQDPPGQGELFG